MKCWKCGKEIMDGAARCPSCGATQDRPAPVTEPGRAMRMLYDRYGAQEVLKNSAYLVNGLGDLAEDTKKLRNQLKMGMDAGMGRAYLEQLAVGAPDSSFDSRVKQLLTEDAGLNDKAAEEIAGYFDEMIGWRSVPRPQAKTVPPQDDRQNAGKQAPGTSEVDRSTRPVKPEPEINRSRQHAAQQMEIDRSKPQEHATAVPQKKGGWKGLYAYEKAAVLCFAAALVLGLLLNKEQDPTFVLDYVPYTVMIIPFFMSFSVTEDNLRTAPHGGAMLLTVLVGALILFNGIELSEKYKLISIIQNGDNNAERLAWQQHLATQDIIFIITSVLLFIQMLRHRILERKRIKA